MEKLYSIQDVCEATSLSRSTIEDLVENNEFPKPFPISRRRRAWYAKDVDQWIDIKRQGEEDDEG